MDKLLRRDNHTEDEVAEMITWCQSHDFWTSVIRSPENLRKHFDTMCAQRDRDARRPKESIVQVKSVDNDYLAEIERRNKESVPMPKGFKDALRKKAV